MLQDPFAEVKNRVHYEVIAELGPELYEANIESGAIRERVMSEIRVRLDAEAGIAREDRQRLNAEIADDILGHGPLERPLADETVTEIMINGPFEVWVEREGRLFETSVQFTDESHLRRVINKIVAQVGRRIDESSPMVDARLPDGSRVNAVLPPLSLSGPLVTIRKFSKRRLDLDDIVRLGTLTPETVDFLARCVRAELNVVVSGGTGTGKTTLLNAMSTAIPDRDRIITIEDAAELRLNQGHVLRLEARPKNIEGEGEIPIRRSCATRCACARTASSSARSRRRGARHAPGDEHRPRRLALDGARQQPARCAARIETMVLMAGYDLPVKAIRSRSPRPST
jgi:pilus assembly protein CpaF